MENGIANGSDVAKGASQGATMMHIMIHANCTNQSKSFYRDYDNLAIIMLSSVQFVCHVLSFFLAMVAFFVVKYYKIAGHRMNHLLLLLALMEILYNGVSVFHHLALLLPTYSVPLNIYMQTILALLSTQHTILTRNWWTALIAIARYLVVSRPLAKCHLSTAHSNVAFGAITVLGAFYTVVFTAWFRIYVVRCGNSSLFSLHIWDVHDPSAFYRVADSLTVGLKSLLPLVLVIVFSLLTNRTVRRPTVRKNDSSFSSVKHNSLRTSRTLLLICLLFAICQLPYAMTILFCFLDKTSIITLYRVAKRVTLLLVAVNSLGNMAIYFVRSKDFRSALRDIRRCRCNFVQTRKDKQRQRGISSWASYSQTKERRDESFLSLQDEDV